MDASLYFTGGIHFLDPFVVVVVDILSDSLCKGVKVIEVFLKAVIHFVLHSAEEGLHNPVIIAVAFSGHGLPNTMLC